MTKVKRTLFHYTSVEGLLGIISSKTIWATNILFLNDRSEINYSMKLLKSELHHFKQQHLTTALFERKFFSLAEEKIDDLFPSQHFDFFVCSFSEKKDLLSQWRGYCPKGSGFSLGFEFSLLNELAEKCKFELKPCIYDEEGQIKAIRNLINETSDTFNGEIGESATEWDTKSKGLAADFIVEFFEMAPTFKHPSFIEEKEWRLIATLKTSKGRELTKFRPRQSVIVPYIEISLPVTENKDLIINEIIVGPTNEDLVSKTSVEMLRNERKVSCDKISNSTIPYRNF